MARQLVYTVTSGRSGTVFLTALLKANFPPENSQVFHERTGFPNFGVHTPDASHATAFNSVGNAPNVRLFFRQKLERDLDEPVDCHVEVSHFLCKAGLVENLPLVSDRAEIHLIALQRDPFKTAWSFINRFDFFNSGFTWLFSLDPRYRNLIVPSAPFLEHGMFGSAIWYVAEMKARTAYYRELVREEMPEIHFHDVLLENLVTGEGASSLLRKLGYESETTRLPGKENATKQECFGESDKELARSIFERRWGDPEAIGVSYFESGKRLSQGPTAPKAAQVNISVRTSS